MNWAMLAIVATSCGSTTLDAAPAPRKLTPVAHDALCVTKGAVDKGAVTEPTVRAFARGSDGDAAQLTFTYRGQSAAGRELASGQLRRQVGLKLRAQDSCNVVYVMWRLDPKPRLEVSVKSNPGKHTHDECGAEGYTKVKPAANVAELEDGKTYTLRAEISGDELVAWIDGALAWRGTLPSTARDIRGPAGLRSDNVQFDIVEFAAPSSAPDSRTGPVCKKTEEG